MKKMFGVLSLIAIMTVAFTAQATQVDNFVKTELVCTFEPVTVIGFEYAQETDTATAVFSGEFLTLEADAGGLNYADIVSEDLNYNIDTFDTIYSTLKTYSDTGGVDADIVSNYNFNYIVTGLTNSKSAYDTGGVSTND